MHNSGRSTKLQRGGAIGWYAEVPRWQGSSEGLRNLWAALILAFKTNLPLESYSLEILKCFMSAFILRSSACTVNDIIDRDMDAGVGMPVEFQGSMSWESWHPPLQERTQHRPLPSGRVSVFAAIIFLALQYVVGITFFCLAFSDLA